MERVSCCTRRAIPGDPGTGLPLPSCLHLSCCALGALLAKPAVPDLSPRARHVLFQGHPISKSLGEDSKESPGTKPPGVPFAPGCRFPKCCFSRLEMSCPVNV